MKIIEEIAALRKRAELDPADRHPHGQWPLDEWEARYVEALHNAWPAVERVVKAADVILDEIASYDGDTLTSRFPPTIEGVEKLRDALAALSGRKEEEEKKCR